MRKIFITGANGFIGHNLVNYLTKSSWQIYALLRPGSLPSFELKENIHIVYGDLTDKNSLRRIVPGNCYIVNLAANPYHPKLSYVVNVDGVNNLIKIAGEKKARKFIQISSQATKVKDQGVYAKTKSLADEIIKKSNLKYVILKPSLVYGQSEKGLFSKIRFLIEKIPFIPVFGDGQVKVDVIYIEDLCRLIEFVLNDEKNVDRVWDTGSGNQITYNDYYYSIAKILNRKISLIHIPVFMGIYLGKIMTKLLTNPPFYVDNVLGSTQPTNCDPTPLLRRYHFKSTSWQQGLKKIFDPKKVNMAVVGLGKMGTLHLTLLNLFFKEVKITALVDTNQQLFNTVKSMGISGNFYLSLAEALNREKIDAVYITTPTFTHFDILKTALSKNLDVFIEKPVSLNPDQLRLLKKIKTDSIIHVGYTLLFNKIYRHVSEIIKTKKYGNIISFNARFAHGEVFGPKKGWMFSKKIAGGGVMMNPGPHLFSLINLFFGEPKKITGRIVRRYSTEVDDEANLKLNYGKFYGKLFLSWSIKNKRISETIINIKFEKANLKCDGEKIEITNQNDKKSTIDNSMLPDLTSDVFNLNPKANGDAYFIEDKLFVESIMKNKKDNINSLNFALSTESLIYESYQAADNS